MVKTPPENLYSGEYEVVNGERRFSPWMESKEDLVDYIGERSGTIRSLYTKRDGKIYRTFGGQEIDLHEEFNRKVKKGNA